ncbi:unnamed protein product [Paramecium pentaurelia]|uniref:Uncharacterized protein n=1 Tax=Paramecium pentaurelia TaxID=43138 RepID=A0A8S1TQS2_9CILI|nr:unnamed protein product [Paramecium pentaurelia]
MGQSQAQPMKALFNVGSDNEFQVKLTLFLGQDSPPILPIEAREIIKHEKFAQLLELLIERMQHENNKVVQNTLKNLTIFIPILLAENHQLIISNNSRVEVEVVNRITVVKADEDIEPLDAANLAQPRIFRIIDNLMILLFRPGFTIQGRDTFSLENDPRLKSLLKQWLDKDIKLKLENIWRGLATLTKYPNDQKQYYENRVLVLSCLLACLEEQLYLKEPKSSQALSYLAFEDHVEMFASLWAVILFHKHGYFWFQDNLLYQQKTCRYMAILSAQILNIIFSFESDENKFRKIVIETNLLDYSFDLLIENTQQSLISDSNFITTKGHDNKGVQEFLGLLYFLLTKNKYAEDYLKHLSKQRIINLLQLLLYYIAQFMDNEVNYEVYQISLELLDYLFNFENIGKISQEIVDVQYRVKVLPITYGTYQDYILSYYSHLLLLDFRSRTKFYVERFKKKNHNYENMGYLIHYKPELLCRTIYKMSQFTKQISLDASLIFDEAIKKYYLYEFLFLNTTQISNQELLTLALFNFIKNGCWTVLYQLLQNCEQIVKFQFTDKKLFKFFQCCDEVEQELQNKQTNKSEQLERFQSYMEIWKDVKGRFQGIHIQQLKQIIGITFQLLNSASKVIYGISKEEFINLFKKTSWSFILEFQVELEKRDFRLDIYAFNQYKQQLEYMPLIDLEKCIFI